MIIVIMGVSGVGKTTVGQALAQRMGWRFLDADDFHSKANIEKMHRGQPLNDADRDPWLTAMNAELCRCVAAASSAVLACSALKQSYRVHLARSIEDDVHWVHLEAPFQVILDRMEHRKHFMPPSLLQSQFDTLEMPHDAMVIDVREPLDESIAALVRQVAQWEAKAGARDGV